MSKTLTPEEIELIAGDKEMWEELKRRVTAEERRRFLHYRPYPKQMLFHNSRAIQRIMSGANQSGKSIAGSMETSMHATGVYPSWHHGQKAEPRVNPLNNLSEINGWVLAPDTKTLRDSLQAKIIGTKARDYTDGAIHGDLIDRDSIIMMRNVPDLVDTVMIKHETGCMCRLQFRSYEQGRGNLQSATVDFVYCDEEPPEDIIGELRARIAASGGFLYMAFTPLKGMTPLVQEFWLGEDREKFLVCMNVYDAGHFTPEKLARLKSLYSGLSHAEREARMMGLPTTGSGMIFPFSDADIVYDPFSIPETWKQLGAIDFGRGSHPFAAGWAAWDPQSDCMYLYDCIKVSGQSMESIARELKHRGEWHRYAYPADFMRNSGVGSINGEERTEGWKYKELFEKEGIHFTPHQAMTDDESTRVEVGLIEMREMMARGKFKVARHLYEWFKEKGVYRYGTDQKPIKVNDDLMDMTRYLTIMKRYAKSKIESIWDLTGTTEGDDSCQDNTPVF